MASSTKADKSKEKQGKKKAAPEVNVTVVQFDTERFETVRSAVAIGEFQPLGADEYTPRGGTPLLDAMGRFVLLLDGLRKKKKVTIGLLADASGSMGGNREAVVAGINEFVSEMGAVDAVDEEAAGKVLCVVLTDGLENASREMTAASVRALIAEREKDGWTFIYLGANQDAWGEAGHLGYSGGVTGQSVNYVATPTGTASALRSVAGDAASYLADNAGYANARAMSSKRSLSEDGDESLENAGATPPRPNAWGGQPGMGDVGKGSRAASYGNVDDALKAAKEATRR